MNLQNSNTNTQNTFVPLAAEVGSNVLDFPAKLKKLREDVSPDLIKQREKRDESGSQLVDYIEWHTVADILDETALNWVHSVKDIRKLGEIITVTVAITIDGVSREGIGTGNASNETGIKKAEHDALKRAAVKFGVARELYKHMPTEIEGSSDHEGPFPDNPMAKSLSDLVTGKQLRMIYALSRETGVNANEECDKKLGCNSDELSKKGASSFIDHLQSLKENQRLEEHSPVLRAG